MTRRPEAFRYGLLSGKKTVLLIGAAVLILGSLVSALFVGEIRGRSAEQRRIILGAEHGTLLKALRTLMNSPEAWQRHSGQDRDGNDFFVVRKQDAQFKELVPPVLVQADAKYLIAYTNVSIVLLSALPRMYLLAFNEGVQEYGGEKITNGLWFSIDPGRDRSRGYQERRHP